MAYNDVQGQAITTVTGVPEPTVIAFGALAAVGGLAYRRRTAAK
jgi:MYXO-CTERM domain-containing protein